MPERSIQIFLQTALSHTFVALLKGSESVDLIKTYLDFKSDNTYVADMETLLARNLFKPGQLDRIYVLTGPGYFTGIRAGLVIAKAFCDSLRINVGLMDSFDYLRACIPEEKDVSIVIAASRKEGYLARFQNRQKVSEELIALSMLESLPGKEAIFSETPFIQTTFAAIPIHPKPVLCKTIHLVTESAQMIPHYIRGEADLFQVI